jgi:hypothetical protein
MEGNRSMSWLNHSNFSLLVDYYTEVQSRPYGSGCTRENTLPWLKQLDPGYLCIYAKGHSGYTTWRSSLKTEHRMLAQDMPALFRELTREAGCRLVLYYSGLLDGLAGERHPDWIMRDRESRPFGAWFEDFNVSRAFAICPQSGYWDEWAAIQLRELVQGYDPDGIWVDGDWPGPCYCDRCLEQFRRDNGVSGKLADLRTRPDFDAGYALTWNRITHRWRERFRSSVKALKADCAYSAGNVSPRGEFAALFDWRSGDFFSPGIFHLHDMARMMRWYGTMDTPYDAYLCDTSFTHARKQVRSRSKTLQRMMQEAATVVSNGGAVGYWTYPLGNGAWVPSRMRKALAVRRFLKEREDSFQHTRSAQWTAILATDASQETIGNAGIQGAHKALAALHLSPDILDEKGWRSNLPYDLAVIPEQRTVDQATLREIEAFVRRGGNLLTTGASIMDLRNLIGVSNVRRAELTDGHVLLKSHDEPTGIGAPWDRVDPSGARELYPLYLSWDPFNAECRTLANNWPMHGQLDEESPHPAGCPAAVARQLGKGWIVHVCTELFGQYQRLGDPQMLAWVREILQFLQPHPLFSTDAPSWVDVSLRARGNGLLLHFVNQSSGRDLSTLNTDDLWVDEIPTIGPIAVRLRSARRPDTATVMPDGTPLDFTYESGSARFSIPRLNIHTCVAVGGWVRPTDLDDRRLRGMSNPGVADIPLR